MNTISASAYSLDLNREFPFTVFSHMEITNWPDLPGGSKRFHKQLMAWTRDLKFLGHEWTRDKQRVFCSRCQYTVQHITNSRIEKSSHRLLRSYREVVQQLGYCNMRIVTHVMES